MIQVIIRLSILSRKVHKCHEEICVSEGLFVQWSCLHRKSLNIHNIIFVSFRAFRGKEVIHQLPSFTLRPLAALRDIDNLHFHQELANFI
jgi:hypothetical protein